MSRSEDQKKRFYLTVADGEYSPEQIGDLFDAWLIASGETLEPLEDSPTVSATEYEAPKQQARSKRPSNRVPKIETHTGFALIIENGRFNAIRMPDGQRREVQPFREYKAEQERNAELN